jgi:hypothetical protein
VLHGVEGVLGGVEESIVEIEEIVFFDSLDFFRAHCINPGVELVVEDNQKQVIHGSFHLQVFAGEVVSLLVDILFLRAHKGLEGKGHVLVGKRDQGHLRNVLQVDFYSIFNYVVHVDDQLLQLVEALVDVVEIRVDVHRSPGQGRHSRMKLELHICDMR